MVGSIVETDSIYGDNWDFYQNFEQLPNSGLRLPSYLLWLENHWYLYGDNDFEQVRLALSKVNIYFLLCICIGKQKCVAIAFSRYAIQTLF